LIGIAGEDDLDAPDLEAASSTRTVSDAETLVEGAAKPGPVRPEPPQGDAQARSLRLIAEIGRIESQEELWRWAYRRILEKNSLPRAFAASIERRFAERVQDLEGEAAADPAPSNSSDLNTRADEEAARQEDVGSGELRATASANSEPAEVGESNYAVAHNGPLRLLPPRPVAPKTLRLRDRGHLEAVAQAPCLVCGRSPADPHHLRFAQPNALGRKSSDEFVVPLCRLHHDELHKRGDEHAWWQSRGIDPVPIALGLWRASRHPASRLECAAARE
jgi:hypothetical protein